MNIVAAAVSLKPERLHFGLGIATNPVTPTTGINDIAGAAVLVDDTTVSATIVDVKRDPIVAAAAAVVNLVANSGASAAVAVAAVAEERARAVVVTLEASAGRSLAVDVMLGRPVAAVASVAVDESTEVDADVLEKVAGSAAAMGLISANPLAQSTELPGCKAP